MKNKLICVYNQKNLYDDIVLKNKNLENIEIFGFDNSFENISITKRYNSFIENYVDSNEPKQNDFWCVFIHQDFGFEENLENILVDLGPESVYGAVGVKIFKGLFFGKSGKDRKLRFKRELKLTIGRILQGCGNSNFKKHGRFLPFQLEVDALDCCCFIIHSSLIRKHNLRFDENLSFHMYVEDICYRLKHDYNVSSKVKQMKCFHIGEGSYDEEFYNSAEYLKNKFKINSVPSTCWN